jgi:hypothetical protein
VGDGGQQAPPSIAIADAKFGINVGMTAISSTSSFFFISHFFQVARGGTSNHLPLRPFIPDMGSNIRSNHTSHQYQLLSQMQGSALTLGLLQSVVLVISFSYRSPFKPQDEAQQSTANQESAS